MRRTALAGVVALVLAGCGGSGSGYGAAPTKTTPESAPASAAAPGGLTIGGFAYDPTPLTAAPGAVITVANRDGSTHTVTSDAAGLFHSGDVSKGGPVTFTAPTKPGTYTFHCDYHASMHGTLVVR